MAKSKANLTKDKELLHLIDKHLKQIQETIKIAGSADVNNIAKNHIYASSLAQHLEVIGELGHKLTESTKQDLLAIEFEALYRMRNSIAHSYDSISPKRIVSLAIRIATSENRNKIAQRITYCAQHSRNVQN